MDPNEVPTKGNLVRARNSLKLSRQGYELMDKKRNILIRELTKYIEQAKVIQISIDEAYKTAYAALQRANIRMGIDNVQAISRTVDVDESIDVRLRSVMGTEIPLVRYAKEEGGKPAYSFYSTYESLDEAKKAAGVEEETETWSRWKELGYEVIHGSKALFGCNLIWGSRGDGQIYKARFFGKSQVQAIV